MVQSRAIGQQLVKASNLVPPDPRGLACRTAAFLCHCLWGLGFERHGESQWRAEDLGEGVRSLRAERADDVLQARTLGTMLSLYLSLGEMSKSCYLCGLLYFFQNKIM